MDKALLDEVIDCLPGDRTLFRYARGDYALMLLARIAGEGMALGELRRSAYGRLLDKPSVRPLLANLGNGRLSRADFDYAYTPGRQDFLLTLGRWNENGRAYNQTSRHGANLVLRLNFNTRHDREFARAVGPLGRERFVYDEHPVMRAGERHYFRHTLAWVRMDVDFENDEVLIEEIQTDWLRYAQRYLRWLKRCAGGNYRCPDALVVDGKVEAAVRYVERTLAPFAVLWDEAALSAAIGFIYDELGIRRVYYHAFETGNVLKKIRERYPPRSLYTDLPRRFCFRLTDEMPRMFAGSRVVKRKLKCIRQPRWHYLDR